MTIASAYEGGATIGATEYSLPNNSTALTPIAEGGIYQIFLDVAELTSAEQYELKIKEKITSSGSQRIFMNETIIGPVTNGAMVLPSFILLYGWDVTLKKLLGTDRTIGWSIRKVG